MNMSAIVVNLHIRTPVLAPWRTFRNVRKYISWDSYKNHHALILNSEAKYALLPPVIDSLNASILGGGVGFWFSLSSNNASVSTFWTLTDKYPGWEISTRRGGQGRPVPEAGGRKAPGGWGGERTVPREQHPSRKSRMLPDANCIRYEKA